jgi:thiol:disulfide interchange protein DsbA
MLKRIIKTGLALSLFIFTSFSFAAGQGYENLKAIQPTQDTDKVEVIEFFWYGCPHCYKFEPEIEAWKATLPENVVLIKYSACCPCNAGKAAGLFPSP